MRFKFKKTALILGFLLGSGVFAANDINTVEDIKTAVQSLTKEKSFAFFDLNLSDVELKELQSLQVKITNQYNNFGNIEVFPEELKDFLKEIGPNDQTTIEKTSKIIKKIVTNLIKASGSDTAHICIRTTVPNTFFDIPRWHTDGYYYTPRSHQYKFVLSIKGPTTLFYIPSKDTKEQFLELQDKGDQMDMDMDIGNRKIIAALLDDKSKLSSPSANQGCAFIVGNGDDAAVHSEPPMTTQRIFIAVIPGTKEQIAYWASHNK